MHGLVNRSIQSFVEETYGPEAWQAVADSAGIGPDGFEAMLLYDDSVTERMLNAISLRLDKPREMVLEDIGTFVVSNGKFERLRRLLRFGGETFVDFLNSLDELHGRVNLALPDLEGPRLELSEVEGDSYRLQCHWHFPGACHVVMGVLRAMADDYGALVLLDYVGGDGRGEGELSIDLLDSRFAEGRAFQLALMSE